MFLYIPFISLILPTHCKLSCNAVLHNWFFTIVIWIWRNNLWQYVPDTQFQNHIAEIWDKDWGHTQICRCPSRWERAIFSFLQRKVYFIPPFGNREGNLSSAKLILYYYISSVFVFHSSFFVWNWFNPVDVTDHKISLKPFKISSILPSLCLRLFLIISPVG